MDFSVRRLAADAGTFLSRAVQVEFHINIQVVPLNNKCWLLFPRLNYSVMILCVSRYISY